MLMSLKTTEIQAGNPIVTSDEDEVIYVEKSRELALAVFGKSGRKIKRGLFDIHLAGGKFGPGNKRRLTRFLNQMNDSERVWAFYASLAHNHIKGELEKWLEEKGIREIQSDLKDRLFMEEITSKGIYVHRRKIIVWHNNYRGRCIYQYEIKVRI